MSVEELLKPRYKVIADYPRSRYIIGEIIFHGQIGKETQIPYYKYPHLFQPLQWWEERKPEEMNGICIKGKRDRIFKIKKHFTSDGNKHNPAPFFTIDDDEWAYYYNTLRPELITEEEYTQYITNKNA